MSRKLRFRGESDNKVDTKGRVSIPASFRRVLEAGDPAWTEGLHPEFVIVYGGVSRQYLECYTMQAIDEVDEKIEKLPRGSMQRRHLERMFSGQSVSSTVDETGRIVLPKKLRDKIGIDKTAFFIASGDTFEIWNPDTYNSVHEQEEAELDDLPEDFDPVIWLDQAPGE